mmetsp:Transcript_15815/g.26699  ORF Transcript_15815/g.26699 Transcript_15815/m.26699 type:complete len:258 (-) Transcript_15815:348-1121(-)
MGSIAICTTIARSAKVDRTVRIESTTDRDSLSAERLFGKSSVAFRGSFESKDSTGVPSGCGVMMRTAVPKMVNSVFAASSCSSSSAICASRRGRASSSKYPDSFFTRNSCSCFTTSARRSRALSTALARTCSSTTTPAIATTPMADWKSICGSNTKGAVPRSLLIPYCVPELIVSSMCSPPPPSPRPLRHTSRDLAELPHGLLNVKRRLPEIFRAHACLEPVGSLCARLEPVGKAHRRSLLPTTSTIPTSNVGSGDF